ncbi:MAG: mechanosensitive ion channel family protein [Gammaproteobacteria bacterium]|jgi:small conductance mechanosensitive channel|nr:mechanosensitive ion channel family protein [Gammaproteobacteria bacterium]
MSSLDFVPDLVPLMLIAGRIALIFILALGLIIVQRKLIAKTLHAMPEPHDETDVRSGMITSVISKIATIVISLVGILMVLGVLQVDTTPLLATLGVVSLGLGFAVQNIIRDYLQGFFIFIEDWYRPGDWVVIAGMEGTVEQITPRRTVLREINGTMHIIPNSQIPHASNQTRDWARINLFVTVAYKEDIGKVYKVIDEVCQGLQDDPEFGILLTTTPSAMRVSDLGDHGVDICIRGDTKPGEQWALTGELRKRIKNRFDQEDIEIPWPHTKVYFGDPKVAP